jgi:hypothetical protein
VIKKVIEDETWYEGERPGGYVSSDDPVVREEVCLIILRVGRELLETFTTQLTAQRVAISESGHDQAA